MRGPERCGRPYSHSPHTWQEGPAEEPEYHRCDGSSDEIEAHEANEHADDLFARGYYEDAS